MTRRAATATFANLSPADSAAILDTAREVWNEIGYDCCAALEEAGESSPSASEIAELVLDGFRLHDELRRGRRGRGARPDLAEALESSDFSARRRFVAGAFA